MLIKIQRKVVIRSISLRGHRRNDLHLPLTQSFDQDASKMTREGRPKPLLISFDQNSKKTNSIKDDAISIDDVNDESKPGLLRRGKRKSSAQRVFLDHDSPIKKKNPKTAVPRSRFSKRTHP